MWCPGTVERSMESYVQQRKRVGKPGGILIIKEIKQVMVGLQLKVRGDIIQILLVYVKWDRIRFTYLAIFSCTRGAQLICN